MKTNVFVGNLPYTVTSEELEELFAEVGNVSGAKVIQDRYTNRSRGFGFVEFETEDAAHAAIEKFNGFSLNDRQIVVSEARSTGRRDGGGGDGRRDGGGYNRGPRNRY